MARPDKWFWHLEGVFRKGMKACLDGGSREQVPYKGFRGVNRLRADQWRAGWDMQDAENKRLASENKI